MIRRIEGYTHRDDVGMSGNRLSPVAADCPIDAPKFV